MGASANHVNLEVDEEAVVVVVVDGDLADEAFADEIRRPSRSCHLLNLNILSSV